MPLASAACSAVVTNLLPMTTDCLAPPSVLMYEIAARPGGRREPEIMAAMVSSIWCLVRSTTSLGMVFLVACEM